MKITTKQPKKGQFVAVWKFEGMQCCDSFKINKDGSWSIGTEGGWDAINCDGLAILSGAAQDTIYIKL